jgi:hypothetical protein
MSEYGVVRRHRGDGSAGYLNKAATPQKNLRIIYAECSYDPHVGGIFNADDIVDPATDPGMINIAGQYGGPIQWLPSDDGVSVGLRVLLGLDPANTEWGWCWNAPNEIG